MSGAWYEYSPGRALGVCGPRVAALVDLPPEAGLVPGLFDLIGSPEANLDEVLELLITPGLRAIAHFALAEHTDEGLRVLVRGRYLVNAGGQTLAGHGLWTDRIVQADRFTLIDPESDAAEVTLPLPGGVVLAARLAGGGGSEGPAATAQSPVASTVSAPSVPSVSSVQSGPSAHSGPPAPSGTFAPSAPEAAAVPSEVPSVASQASPAAPPPTQPSPYAPSPDAASVPAGSESGHTGHTLPSPFTSPITQLPSPPPAVTAAPIEQPTFIESLPWSTDDESGTAAAPTAPVPLPTPPSDAGSAGAPSEATISRDSLPGEAVQTVVAARCPSGHLSPAYAGVCRVCGQPMPPQQPVEIPRPPLGVLRLSNGDTVLLDRGCILGRNPRVPSPYAGERPNLVKLIDPDKDVSGQHLEVRLEYWHVAVKDLGSTNGTQVVLPGENPVTLRPNDPMMIEPGTTVILAGVFSFVFEATP